MTSEARPSDAQPRAHEADQALFGYDGGHRLLAASTPFDAETLALLNRLTDGTGAEATAGFDGYLSGYPLPQGRYALTRTWRAHEATRPGAVWTHVLIVEAKTLTALRNPNSIASLLRRPTPDHDLDLYTYPVILQGSEGAGTAAPFSRDWRPVVSALYAEDGPAVWLTADEAAFIEPEVLRLWWWQWPALRRQTAFCLGATSRRRTGSREFDLLVVPYSRRLSAKADFGPPPTDVTPAGTLITADVEGKMPESFRSFVYFCGAETQRRTAAALLSDVWMVADDPSLEPKAAQALLAQRISESFPDPASMRRLKRILISPDKRLPARWEKSDSLALLVGTSFASTISAHDIDAEDLLEAAVDSPELLLRAAAGDIGDQQQISGTAASALPQHARAALAQHSSPSWLPEIVHLGGDVGASVLVAVPQEDHEAWGRAFWALDAEQLSTTSREYERTLRHHTVGGQAPGPNLVRETATLGWLAAYAHSPREGIRWLAETHTNKALRTASLDDLAAELKAENAHLHSHWRAAISDGPLLQALLQNARKRSSEGAASLLFLADPTTEEMRAGGLTPWVKLQERDIEGPHAAHLLRITPGGTLAAKELGLLSRAFGIAWAACARSDWLTWEALGDYPANLGFGADWDRALRLSHTFARTVLAKQDATTAAHILDGVRRSSPAAAIQLADELAWLTPSERRRSELHSEPSPTVSRKSGKGTKKQGSKNPIDQARELAADWWPW